MPEEINESPENQSPKPKLSGRSMEERLAKKAAVAEQDKADHKAGKINPLDLNPLTGKSLTKESKMPPGMLDLGMGKTNHYTAEYIDSFEGYDVDMNTPSSTWEKQRAKNQSGWAQAGGAITQLALGEIVGGTIEGVGGLFSITNWGDIAEGEAQNTANWLQEAGRALKEKTQTMTPIYEEEPGEFNMSDFGWWMKNGVSVGSTLSMMLPSMGFVKGLSMLGRASGGLKLLSKMGALGAELGVTGTLANTVAKGVAQAVVSRQLENTMEAQGVFDEQVEYLMSKGLTREDAVKGAGLAASDVYKKNWAMLAMDIPQYVLMGSKFNPASAALDKTLTKAMGKSATPFIANAVKNTTVDLAGEGVEESFQFIAGEEAKYLSNRAMGVDYAEPETTLDERISGYLKSGELWSSAFWGAAGGGVFSAVGPVVKNALESDADKSFRTEQQSIRKKDIETASARFAMWGKRIREADMTNDPAVMAQARVEMNIDMTIDRAQKGNIDAHIEQLEAQASLTEEDIEKHNQANPDNEISGDFIGLIPDLIKDAKEIKEMYSKNARKYSPAYVPAITTAEFSINKYSDQLTETQSKAKLTEGKIRGLHNLSGKGALMWEATKAIKSKEQSIRMVEDILKRQNLNKRTTKAIKKELKGLKGQLSEAHRLLDESSKLPYEGTKQEITNAKRKDTRVLNTIGTQDELIKLNAKSDLLEFQIDDAQETLKRLTDKKLNEKDKNLHHLNTIKDMENSDALNKYETEIGESVDKEVKDAIEARSLFLFVVVFF